LGIRGGGTSYPGEPVGCATRAVVDCFFRVETFFVVFGLRVVVFGLSVLRFLVVVLRLVVFGLCVVRCVILRFRVVVLLFVVRLLVVVRLTVRLRVTIRRGIVTFLLEVVAETLLPSSKAIKSKSRRRKCILERT
jgi:hypothetical protein